MISSARVMLPLMMMVMMGHLPVCRGWSWSRFLSVSLIREDLSARALHTLEGLPPSLRNDRVVTDSETAQLRTDVTEGKYWGGFGGFVLVEGAVRGPWWYSGEGGGVSSSTAVGGEV